MKKINNYKVIKNSFDSLGLKKPLIGIAFANEDIGKKIEKSQKITRNQKSVPAGCAFWEMAVKKLFYTVTEDHENCTVGMYTHNFLRGKEDKTKLMRDISLMKKIDYIRMEEIKSIPILKKNYYTTIYGPWSEFQSPAVKKLSIIPAVGFVFADAKRGLILSEAASRVDKGFPPAMGRPACAIIPQVVNSRKASVSFGCCGARTYVHTFGKEVDLWVFPGDKMTEYARAISLFSKANEILSTGHGKRRHSFSKGKSLELVDALK